MLTDEMTSLSKERKNMELNEEGDDKSASEDDSPSAPENTKEEEAKNSAPDVCIIGPEHTVSPDVSDAVGKEPSKEKASSGTNYKEATPLTPAPAKKSRPAKPPKPPKQPEFHSDAEPRLPSKSARKPSESPLTMPKWHSDKSPVYGKRKNRNASLMRTNAKQ